MNVLSSQLSRRLKPRALSIRPQIPEISEKSFGNLGIPLKVVQTKPQYREIKSTKTVSKQYRVKTAPENNIYRKSSIKPPEGLFNFRPQEGGAY